MFGIPLAPLALGLGGLIPFLYAAAATLDPVLRIGPSFAPDAIFEIYGVVILCFMAGALWGFASKEDSGLTTLLGLSVIPAILIFLATLFFDGNLILTLIVAFPALLLLDFYFTRKGLAPAWWMRLRTSLTTVVTACLLIGAFA